MQLFDNKELTKALKQLVFSPISPRFLCIFVNIFRGVVDGGWWVLMVSIKFIVNPHIIITQHSTFNPTHHHHSTFITQHPSPNIQSHTTSTSNTHPPTFNPTHHHHSTFITQHSSPNTHHPTFNIQSLISSTPNIHHPTPIISHPFNFIISFFLCKFAVK